MAMTGTTDITRRHPGLWWLLGVMAATLVFAGLGAAVALVAAWRLPQRRVAFIVLAVVLIVWTVFFTPLGGGIEHGSSVQHH
jgi:pimeloyl-ACP methyl ester carboxylesterase